MVKKEFHQIARDPRLRRIIFIAPVIQLMVFGYAVSTDVRHTATFVVDHDKTQAARDLLDAFTASGYFDVVGRSERAADAVTALDHGRRRRRPGDPPGVRRRPRGRRAGGDGATVQVLVDGTNSNIATVALGYAERIVQTYGAALAAGETIPGGPPAALDVRERAWYNPDLASRNYNVPAVVGTLMMLVSLLLTALAIVREREIGTLEQLMVSPLRPSELIAGKTIPFALIALFDLTLVTTLAILWFRIPFKGSLPVLLGGQRPLPALGAGHRPLHLHHLVDPAGSLHGDLPHLHADDPALRVHVPGVEHARSSSAGSPSSTRSATTSRSSAASS